MAPCRARAFVCTSGLRSLFFFHAPPTTEIYTLSLHDALPICWTSEIDARRCCSTMATAWSYIGSRSEEHTSELQSLTNLVCRLLLEKKKQTLPSSTMRCFALTHAALDDDPPARHPLTHVLCAL